VLYIAICRKLLQSLRFFCRFSQSAQASKGAVIRFYETLRAELGSQVRVTILMPGYVVSNLTKGKGLQKDGHVGIDVEARDVSSPTSTTMHVLHQ
jgi:short-subunit dehydrogenase